MKEVYLGQNRLVCNCSSTWLALFLKTDRDQIIQDGSTLFCHQPLEWHGFPLSTMPAHIDAVCKGKSLSRDYCGTSSRFPCSIPADGSLARPACIPQSRLCNNMADCAIPGDDENPFVCTIHHQAQIQNSNRIFNLFNNMNSQAGWPGYPVLSPPVPVGTPSPLCRKGLFTCGDQTCISLTKVCNGILDCLDGGDEDKLMCSATTTTTLLTLPPVTQAETSTETVNTVTMDHSTVWSVVEELRGNLTLNWPAVRLDTEMATSTEEPLGLTSSTATTTTISTTKTDTSTVKTTGGKSVGGIKIVRLPLDSHSTSEENVVYQTAPESTTVATHATITFPAMFGPQYVNHFEGNHAAHAEPTTPSRPTSSTEARVKITNRKTVTTALAIPDKNEVQHSENYLRPQRLRLIRSTQPHDVTVAWDTPDTSQIGSWSLVAFIVAWEIQRVGAVKKVKTSPLLSTLVHEYVFHNILPEDSLNITVKAMYEDRDKVQYVFKSEPLLRINAPTVIDKKEIFSSTAQQTVKEPGSMSFEDTMGISVGGALAALMAFLLALYLFKRKKRTGLASSSGTNVRALRMRKVQRTIPPVKNSSSEPIYHEPQYAHNFNIQNGMQQSGYLQQAVELAPEPTLRRPRPANGGTSTTNPEDGYVQILDSSESGYYGPAAGPLPMLSDYSCYSMAAARMGPPSSMLRPGPNSDGSSIAIYTDTDNCSMGYYYHTAQQPQTLEVMTARGGGIGIVRPQLEMAKDVRRFGDTLAQGYRRENRTLVQQNIYTCA
ncbi:hypothetical protein RvY_08497 [Ramazzottius varieornatus]|uniref:Fibronectin type-III domain-containing protein n=1 Tax=Ramazzottius varieornatus TaxID=947166 RepID=A0A1D1V8N5_RAMVA|nr:hypothetical protein RvY_08497 [Ramazzottius varieornatus]